MSLSREQIQKHQKEIIAFGEGKEIEVLLGKNTWHSASQPCWDLHYEYRVKPEPEKPKFGYANWRNGDFHMADTTKDVFFSGEKVFPFVTRTPEIDEILKNAGYELPEEGGEA